MPEDKELRSEIFKAIKRHEGMKLQGVLVDIIASEILALIKPMNEESKQDKELRERICGAISEYTGFDNIKDKLTDHILALIKPLNVEEIEKIIKENLDWDYDTIYIDNEHIWNFKQLAHALSGKIAKPVEEHQEKIELEEVDLSLLFRDECLKLGKKINEIIRTIQAIPRKE